MKAKLEITASEQLGWNPQRLCSTASFGDVFTMNANNVV